MLVPALLVLILGAPAVMLRIRISPLFVLIPLVGGQLWRQTWAPRFGAWTALQIEDVVLCAAAMAYVAGHYRLVSLWRHILPPDPRQRYREHSPVIVPLGRLGRVAPQHRPAALLSRAEIAWFVLQLPLFALLAQGTWVVLSVPRDLFSLEPRWLVQLVQLAWALVLGLLLAGQLFRIVRLLRMERATAKMLLQDALWHETRREQRRIGRWLAWRRLRHRQRND
jgi:hypothetical protein